MTSSINMIAKKFKLEDILELSPDKLTNSEKEKSNDSFCSYT